MIIVIDVIAILLLIAGIILDVEMDDGCFMSCIGFVCFIAAIIATIYISVHCTELKTYDSQIAVIEEQNIKIENEITTIVLSYEKYEKETFVSSKINSNDLDFVAIAEMYPDLKSNELVKNQIEIYTSNNEKLTELKLEKAKGSTYQWWLYFKPFNQGD